ncbi:MAG: YHS domain-containing protein [Armatimonadota bacterium]|nr:YHS domain-containing protein [Armatimonadota bacterium]
MPRDPVCGMRVDDNTPYSIEYDDETYYFCSAACAQEFQDNSEEYVSPLQESLGE